jgi:hypothetical protein
MNTIKNQSRMLFIIVFSMVIGIIVQSIAILKLPPLDLMDNKNAFWYSILTYLHYSAVGSFSHLGAAIALPLLSRSKKIMWSFLGLVTGIIGIVLFFVIEIYNHRSNQPTE